MRTTLPLFAIGVVTACFVTGHARAFSIQSGFTKSCHEEISVEAFSEFLDLPRTSEVPLPKSNTWRKLSKNLDEFVGRELTDQQRFIAFSLVVGVRAPDTEGHSVADLEALRSIHSDPRPEGQYRHALRGLDDDGDEGNVNAVTGTRAAIRESFTNALASLQQPPEEQLAKAPVTLDFYNEFKVDVWQPAFLLAEAMHTVQDSFAHTIRSEADDLRRIATVLNFVDAISTNFKEERDGLPHSDFADKCNKDEVSETREAARRATIALIFTFGVASAGVEDALDSFLDDWVTLLPGCTLENDFCDNA